MRKFVEKRLLPELEQLKDEISSSGLKSVIEKFDGIKHIAKNINEIVSEVIEWKRALLPN